MASSKAPRERRRWLPELRLLLRRELLLPETAAHSKPQWAALPIRPCELNQRVSRPTCSCKNKKHLRVASNVAMSRRHAPFSGALGATGYSGCDQPSFADLQAGHPSRCSSAQFVPNSTDVLSCQRNR